MSGNEFACLALQLSLLLSLVVYESAFHVFFLFAGLCAADGFRLSLKECVMRNPYYRAVSCLVIHSGNTAAAAPQPFT